MSFGFEPDMSTSWSVEEDGVTNHCSPNPVTVTNDAAGNPYSGYTLQGYICTFQHEWAGAAYWLFISKDQFGNPLGEMRPLGPTGMPYTVCLELQRRQFSERREHFFRWMAPHRRLQVHGFRNLQQHVAVGLGTIRFNQGGLQSALHELARLGELYKCLRLPGGYLLHLYELDQSIRQPAYGPAVANRACIRGLQSGIRFVGLHHRRAWLQPEATLELV